MVEDGTGGGIDRRTLLIGGGVGVGLLVAWSLWPRTYRPNLRAAPGEAVFNAFLKIANDGRVIVAVPQAEIGQGVYTSFPQIVADELGADWRTVAVEPAPISPLYANQLLAEEMADDRLPTMLQGLGRWTARQYATRSALMLTGGSSSIRSFEPRLRQAGAAARVLLCMAAAKRWGVEWDTLDTVEGFVVSGDEKIRFAELAEEAPGFTAPDELPFREGPENRLIGQSVPRLDLPSKVDGSAQFAGDIRLPGMVFASVRQGPIGGGRLARIDRKAAEAVPGVVALFENPDWAGAAATNWWAANQALEAMNPHFEAPTPLVSSESVEARLATALEQGEAKRMFASGDVDAAMSGGVFRAHYSVGAAPNAPLETLTATARLNGDLLEIWAPTQAPAFARAAAARVSGIDEARVTLYPMLVGSGYGRKLETKAIEQAAVIAVRLGKPVQLMWARVEETVQDSFRAPAHALLSAKLGDGSAILGWQARIAAPSTEAQLIGRLRTGRAGAADEAEASAVAGAIPPYAIPAVAIDHVPAAVGLETGAWRSGAHSYTTFFTECFIDELARKANIEPLSFRMQMLGNNPRLARVLATAAALGSWDGGVPGSSMGIAAQSCFGSHIALLVEVAIDKAQRIRVDRAVCAVDCGRIINPDIVRQQIEGGIIYGIAGATGAPIGFAGGRPDVSRIADLGLPILANSPEITVELIQTGDEPGGVTELGVPAVAPAIANALFAATGQRLRRLPLVAGSA